MMRGDKPHLAVARRYQHRAGKPAFRRKPFEKRQRGGVFCTWPAGDRFQPAAVASQRIRAGQEPDLDAKRDKASGDAERTAIRRQAG